MALCHTREQAEQVATRLREWLAPKGLALNEDKTHIVPLEDGFDFLGFTIRRHTTRTGGKLLIRPSKNAITRTRQRITAELRSLRGANAAAVTAHLNPLVRGWAAYYRHGVSSDAYRALDNHLWQRLYGWARWTHPNKPAHWVNARYFAAHNPTRQDNWVLGDATTGIYQHKFSWTPITRHTLVKGRASPDDPALTDYWATRRRRKPPPPLGHGTERLLRSQHGRCPVCGNSLLHTADEPDSPHHWEHWFHTIRPAITTQTARDGPDHTGTRLVHTHCATHPGPAQTPTKPPTKPA